MTSRTSLSRSAPALKLFSRYRGNSPCLAGPYVSIGDCLEPYLSDGGLVWLDRGLEPRPGDLVIVDLDGGLRTKALEELADGTRWLVSNVMAIPLLPRWRILGVIVAEWPRLPEWPHP